ncbi:hypothetical protein BDR04DRAFT_1107969, partial [Suillus decipiens]
ILLVPIPYNNFVISVNLQFLSLVKVTLLSIRRFKPIFDPRYSTKNILIILPLIQKFVPSFLSVLLYPVKRDATLVWLRFHI